MYVCMYYCTVFHLYTQVWCGIRNVLFMRSKTAVSYLIGSIVFKKKRLIRVEDTT